MVSFPIEVRTEELYSNTNNNSPQRWSSNLWAPVETIYWQQCGDNNKLRKRSWQLWIVGRTCVTLTCINRLGLELTARCTQLPGKVMEWSMPSNRSKFKGWQRKKKKMPSMKSEYSHLSSKYYSCCLLFMRICMLIGMLNFLFEF